MSTVFTGLQSVLHDFLAIIYPEKCGACGGALAMGEEVVCSHCRIKLPYTNFHETPSDNVLHRVFWGRVSIRLAVALLFFQERGRVQRLLHQLKYRGHEEIGELLGNWHGALLKARPEFEAIEVVVPVPLHQSKLRQRGYNQVLKYATALAAALEVPLAANALQKNKSAKTQTQKNRQERWEAMRQLYSIHIPDQVVGKHVLLIDDVVTTGATVEACADVMLKAGASAVSVASMAYTQ